MTVLIAMIIIQLGIGHLTHFWSHVIASSSATLLRERIFDRALNSKVRGPNDNSRFHCLGRAAHS